MLVAGESEWADGIPLCGAGGAGLGAKRYSTSGGRTARARATRYAWRNAARGPDAARFCGGNTCASRCRFPAGARLGYHELEVSVGAGETAPRAVTRLILCPDRTYEPRSSASGRLAAGLAIALYGLRSERNWGCGDFTDLENLIELGGRRGRGEFHRAQSAARDS